MGQTFSHVSVLLNECIDGLKIQENGIYVDGTLGGGGHSSEIIKRLSPEGRLIGIDQDSDAVEAASKRLADYSDRLTVIRSNFAEMRMALEQEGIQGVNGILLDLGVSSYQLDTAERGFTYNNPDAPLDMRMDQRGKMTASDIVNEYSAAELVRILRDYGEERYATNIANNIVKARETHRLSTSGELVDIIRHSIPMKVQMAGGHPAKRTFQAIRIELNGELEVLESHMQDFIDLLLPGGRLCIITFHSLEDRIVKNAMKLAENPCTCPPNFPVCVCGKKSKGKVITRKPIIPSDEEQEVNSRAKSAKLRIFEKI